MPYPGTVTVGEGVGVSRYPGGAVTGVEVVPPPPSGGLFPMFLLAAVEAGLWEEGMTEGVGVAMVSPGVEATFVLCDSPGLITCPLITGG